MNGIAILLEKAKQFHGDICPGIATGTRMTIAAMRELGMNPLEKNQNLIVYVEIDRCATDAIQAITGCSLGHRTLKVLNFGKFAATFVDTQNGKAVRVSQLPKKEDQPTDMNKLRDMILNAPEEQIIRIQEVSVQIPPEDMPGFPSRSVTCSKCKEQIMDGRDIQKGDLILCKSCSGEAYYSSL